MGPHIKLYNIILYCIVLYCMYIYILYNVANIRLQDPVTSIELKSAPVSWPPKVPSLMASKSVSGTPLRRSMVKTRWALGPWWMMSDDVGWRRMGNSSILPSGKRLHWKISIWWAIQLSMAIFNSYVSLPQRVKGFFHYKPSILGYPYFRKPPFQGVQTAVEICQAQLRTRHLGKALGQPWVAQMSGHKLHVVFLSSSVELHASFHEQGPLNSITS